MRRRGKAAVFTAHVKDRLSGASKGSIRWSFGDGQFARGAKVSRRFAEARARRVVLTARDAAGNESFTARRFVPRAAGAVRALKVARPGRGAGSLTVSGRLVRRASLTLSLRALPTAPSTAGGALASLFSRPPPPGASVAKSALKARGKGTFRLGLPIGRLKPGVYALDVRASERGTSLGSLRLTRRIDIS